MVGGVMAVRVTGHPLVLPVVVAVAVLDDLRFELRVALFLCRRKRDHIVGRGVRGMWQQRAEGHREGDDETQDGAADAVRHD